MSEDRPASVLTATWALAGLVALFGLAALLSLVFSDELVDAWEDGRPDADSLDVPSITPVVVVMLVVIVAILGVLLAFFRARHGWARTAITVLLLLLVVGTLGLLRGGPPALFVVLSLGSIVLDVAAVGALWHRDTTAYLRGAVREPSGP